MKLIGFYQEMSPGYLQSWGGAFLGLNRVRESIRWTIWSTT
jgi:hypothetical protein